MFKLERNRVVHVRILKQTRFIALNQTTLLFNVFYLTIDCNNSSNEYMQIHDVPIVQPIN